MIIQPVIHGGGGGSATPHAIGDSYGGGILACIYSYAADGTPHGIVISSADLSSNTAWSNVTSAATGTTSIQPDVGLANCTAIIGQAGHTASAASMCRAYTGGGYTDWVLPSKADWVDLSKCAAVIGLVASYQYWTSSESASDSAYFYTRNLYSAGSTNTKNGLCRVRAIRYI